MFYSAEPTIFQRAKELRNQPTDAERILWMHLRTRPGGYKFRRQHPSGNYILDFYCHALKLAIEADGSIHNTEESLQKDIERQVILKGEGIRFFKRFNNDEIQRSIETVIAIINSLIDEYCQKKQEV